MQVINVGMRCVVCHRALYGSITEYHVVVNVCSEIGPTRESRVEGLWGGRLHRWQ